MRWTLGAGALVLLILTFAAGSARAATTVYPPGGGAFSGGAEGWATVNKECKLLVVELGLLCENQGAYDGTAGNPAGSFDAHTKAIVNLLSTFDSKVDFRSPDFAVSAAGSATLHLERQFVPSNGLVELLPTGKYSVVLLDRTTGTQSIALEEPLSSLTSTFVGKDAAVSVAAGHTYAVEIQTEVASTAKLGLAAEGDLRFDNVSLTVSSSEGGGGNNGGGGNGGNGGNAGSGGLTDARLEGLIKSSLAGPATVKGSKLYVKAKCPAKVGAACKVTVQGMLKKGKTATTSRTAKIAKGKSKQFVLKVKQTQRGAVAKRGKLLFKETVKAGKAKATVYKSLKLIRR
ncbi:MAG: hypothetical protein JST31_08465 [Actinobacteria bacterium]|nr:hypothetical protein [Actinomycetota bacterium]